MKHRSPTTISATEFKSRCLELMDEVAAHRTRYLITKRGRVVAELREAGVTSVDPIGAMAGSAITVGDIVSPDADAWSGVTDPLGR